MSERLEKLVIGHVLLHVEACPCNALLAGLGADMLEGDDSKAMLEVMQNVSQRRGRPRLTTLWLWLRDEKWAKEARVSLMLKLLDALDTAAACEPASPNDVPF